MALVVTPSTLLRPLLRGVSGLAYTGPYGHVVSTPRLLRGVRLLEPPLGERTGRIYGTTANKSMPLNTPLRAKVRLIRERDGALVREMWSALGTGAWSFENLDTEEVFTVLSYHPYGDHRATVANGLVPEKPGEAP